MVCSYCTGAIGPQGHNKTSCQRRKAHEAAGIRAQNYVEGELQVKASPCARPLLNKSCDDLLVSARAPTNTGLGA
jgi:hypothetical protein